VGSGPGFPRLSSSPSDAAALRHSPDLFDPASGRYQVLPDLPPADVADRSSLPELWGFARPEPAGSRSGRASDHTGPHLDLSSRDGIEVLLSVRTAYDTGRPLLSELRKRPGLVRTVRRPFTDATILRQARPPAVCLPALSQSPPAKSLHGGSVSDLFSPCSPRRESIGAVFVSRGNSSARRAS
jgi:hypothetical protein